MQTAAQRMSDADLDRAELIWAEYQRTHDLSGRVGQAVGIDPISGRVWFGESALDIVSQCRAEGIAAPLFFARVGYPTYLRKGGRR
jgi:hypothetical protein